MLIILPYRDRYRVDEVRYVDEMPSVLEALNGGASTLLTLNGVNTDSGKTTRAAAFDGMSKFKVRVQGDTSAW